MKQIQPKQSVEESAIYDVFLSCINSMSGSVLRAANRISYDAPPNTIINRRDKVLSPETFDHCARALAKIHQGLCDLSEAVSYNVPEFPQAISEFAIRAYAKTDKDRVREKPSESPLPTNQRDEKA